MALLSAVTSGAALGVPAAAAQDLTSPSLSLPDALTRTLDSSAAIRVARETATAAEARARDAGARANPTLGVTHENFGGGLAGGRAETGVSLLQPLGLSGARGAARHRSSAEADAARASAASVEREAMVEAADRFLDAWVLQEKLRHLTRAERVASQAVLAAADRARAGAGAPHERLRAETVLATFGLQRARLEAEVAASRRLLASGWTTPAAPPDSLQLPPSMPAEPPPLDSLLAGVERHPALRRAGADVAAAAWRAREVAAETSFDLGVVLGVKRLAEADATGFTAGLTTTLPLMNRRRGTKSAALSEIEAAKAEFDGVSLRLRREAAALRERLLAAIDAGEAARSRVGPAAREVVRMVTEGFRAGRLGYLDLLDGERSVLEAELLFVQQHADAWRAAVQLALLAADDPGAAVLNLEESR